VGARRTAAGVLGVLLMLGCEPWQEFLDPDAQRPAVRPVDQNPFATPGPAPAPHAAETSYTPTSAAAGLALRVDRIGRQLLVANSQIGLQPSFITLGAAHVEIFHQDTRAVYVTEGLVQACTTEGQLAAVLALELAKMVVEREALSPTRSHPVEQEPPIEVPIGNAGQTGGLAVDQARLVELARYEKRRQAARTTTLPEPQTLAGLYLEKAGYARQELEAIQPLLRRAAENYVLERQLRPSTTGWARPMP
jgi:predicted Zn-dependent protease